MLFMPVVEGADSSINAAGERRLDRRLVGVACVNIAVADIFHAQCQSLCKADLTAVHEGMGRELFAPLRASVGLAEEGATIFSW